jgi:hypothetical protein
LAEERSFFYDGNSCKAADIWTYPGVPTFSIVGSSRLEDQNTTQWFSVVEFIGVQDPVLKPGCHSVPESGGVPATCLDSELPTQPMKLRLRGMHLTKTAEAEKARRVNGTLLRVEGQVEFAPLPGHQYVVTGTLESGRAAVWVEDAVTKLPVTELVHQ